jgi:hypothetical protein
MAARMAMMEITTRSSIKVKTEERLLNLRRVIFMLAPISQNSIISQSNFHSTNFYQQIQQGISTEARDAGIAKIDDPFAWF